MPDCVKTVSDSVQIRPDHMRAATDVADYLVRKGVPFRATHHISGHRRVTISSGWQALTSKSCVLEQQIKVLREMLSSWIS
ncbi:argininosuccinate lyase C-terminal-domain-containing protein [Xylaria cubensis]|nr:argininosuccinate lyase C-terminal-domain-containing protein [Xylaria cubensis]